MKIIIIIAIIVIVLAAVVLALMQIFKGPDLSQYEALKEPRITDMDNRKVVEITVQGKPEEVLMKAFNGVMQAYFKLKGVPKGPNQPAPCLRCPRLEDGQDFESNSNWKGRVAMPVPESVFSLPVSVTDSIPDIRLATWTYGTVAEILHIGPYDQEVPTIKKLEAFIAETGYTIIGEHEEEYLRGPGMPFVTPKDYYTIIRFRIKK